MLKYKNYKLSKNKVMGLILKATMYTAIGLFVLGLLPIVAMTIMWIGYTLGKIIRDLFKN